MVCVDQDHLRRAATRVLLVGVLPRVLVGLVGRHPAGDVLGDELVHPIGVGPRDVAELVVERHQDVREPVQLGLGLAPAACGGHRLDLRIGIGQLKLHHRLPGARVRMGEALMTLTSTVAIALPDCHDRCAGSRPNEREPG